VSEEKQKETSNEDEGQALVLEPELVEEGLEGVAEAEQVAEAAAETLADEIERLRAELEQTRAREAEYLDGWQRARAELANARKRFQREQEQAYANAKADVLARLLPIFDDFERAFETMPPNLSGLTWIEGVALIRRKLQVLLDQEGVSAIKAVGLPFDPFAHQAVTHEPSETVPEGHVIAELQRGYMLGERVLRPSMVRVSSGLPPTPSGGPEAAPEIVEAEVIAEGPANEQEQDNPERE
jgi:molecular chaperone GrpE